MPSLIPEDPSALGTHALVIGVSAYQHLEDGPDPTPIGCGFGMKQLTAAARSASEFAAWLMQNYRCTRAPLRSLRVLLSPGADEQIHPNIAALLGNNSAATRSNVETELVAFRKACDRYRENVVIVYVAGHGVQLSKHGAVVLLNDFGADGHATTLTGAIDMAGVHAGMNHPRTAQTQFWFVDACRQRPEIADRFERLTGALKLDVPKGDAEASPMFLAATTGNPAYARVDGVTLFNEALMWALKGNAAVGPEEGGIASWHISVTELIKRLPARVKELALVEGAEQSVDPAGKIHEAVFHELISAPKVDLRIDLLPEGARDYCSGRLALNASQVIVDHFVKWPLREQVDAGLYLLSVMLNASPVCHDRILYLTPPAKDMTVSVG